MGRAELRRQKREAESGQTKYTFTRAQLDARDAELCNRVMTRYREEVDKYSYDWKYTAFESAFHNFVLMSLLTLRDRYGFGHKRLSDFVDDMHEKFVDVSEGRIDLDDISKVIEEECKLRIVRDEGVEKFENEIQEKGKQPYKWTGKLVI